MKQPKKLTRDQKAIVLGHMLNPKEWMYVKTDGSYLVIINKKTGVTKYVDIFKKAKRQHCQTPIKTVLTKTYLTLF